MDELDLDFDDTIQSLDEFVEDWKLSVKEAAEEALPKKVEHKIAENKISERTRTLFKKRDRMHPGKNTKDEFAEVRRQIQESSIRDFKDWVNECVSEMETANEQGNARKTLTVLKHLTKKPKPPPQGITRKEDGELITSPEEAAALWQKFLSEKFDSTEAEKAERPAMAQIPSHRDPSSALTREEFNTAARLMSNMKAVGPDGVPAEAIKYSPSVKETLFQITKAIWDREELPEGFAQARFVMLYKGKGSANDPARYRCIALLNHSYKILSRILLKRLLPSSEIFLNDWQAGFRPGRGCRDNITILRALSAHFLELGECLAVTFIDYAAAFDSLSHKYIDRVLVEANVPNKERTMFRAIYSTASAFTRIKDADGKQAKSDVFPIRRGVLQGDITSPLFFIMALEHILKTHDNRVDKGVSLLSTIIHTLGYADDAALVDLGDPAGVIRATERLTKIAQGSLKDADMQIKIEKTKGMHIRKQDAITDTTSVEAQQVCKFKCPHSMCNFVFATKHGMQVHASKCRYKEEFVVERILDSKGPTCAKRFKIRWLGYGEEADTWEPRANIHPELIREFELETNRYMSITGATGVTYATYHVHQLGESRSTSEDNMSMT